jgi:hypothetical protein
MEEAMDVRFALFLSLWGIGLAATGAVDYALVTNGVIALKQVGTVLEVGTVATFAAAMIIADVLPCSNSCPLQQS